MRIVCPNCTAQYEIDAELLPEEGREVQCSACDAVWFQAKPTRKVPRAALVPAPNPVPAAPIGPAASNEAPETVASTEHASAAQSPEPTPAPTPPLPRARQLDPSVTQLLREEAEFEARQRAKEAEKIETQPDLGLLGTNPWPAFGNPDELDDTDALTRPIGQPTSTALPDIDDVSASLDPVATPRARGGAEYSLPQTPKARQREFLKGFSFPLVIGGSAAGLYAFAPILAQTIPALAPVLDAYTGTLDQARQSLAALLGR